VDGARVVVLVGVAVVVVVAVVPVVVAVVVEVRDTKVVERGGDVVGTVVLVDVVGIVVLVVVVEAVLVVAGQTACPVNVPDPPTVAVVLILVEEARETPPELVQEVNDAPGFGLKVTG